MTPKTLKFQIIMKLIVGSIYKAVFTRIYILIVYILLVHKVLYKWPYYVLKPKFTHSTNFNA